jgi:hypothetical protein
MILTRARATGTLHATRGFIVFKEAIMQIVLANIPAAVALLVGILILIVPRFLNYFVAIYLIIVGLYGLGILH